MVNSIRKNIEFFVGKLLLCIVSMLAGCVLFDSREVVTTIATQPGEEISKEVIANFDLVGRVSVKADKHGFSGGVRWQHTEISDQIMLFSPLGQTVAQIEQGPEGVSLITSEPETYYASNVENLTEDVLGWRLPLSGLQFWVQGTHFPFTVSEKDLDRNGRTVAIRQNGWKITYLDYFSQLIPAYNHLPRVLELSRTDLKLKLVIDSWDIKD